MTDEEIRLAIDNLKTDERIDVLTRLDNGSKVPLSLIRSSNVIALNSVAMFKLLSEHEVIAYRRVREFNDVYSFKEDSIAIHPSTYHFLAENRIARLLTFARDKKTLTFTLLDEFTKISDLGIGVLRRADFKTCEKFATFCEPDLKSMKLVAEYTTKLVIDDLVREQQTKQQPQSRINLDQNSLF